MAIGSSVQQILDIARDSSLPVDGATLLPIAGGCVLAVFGAFAAARILRLHTNVMFAGPAIAPSGAEAPSPAEQPPLAVRARDAATLRRAA